MEPVWCSYIGGKCEYGSNAILCAKQSTVSCRLRRERIEKERADETSLDVRGDLPSQL